MKNVNKRIITVLIAIFTLLLCGCESNPKSILEDAFTPEDFSRSTSFSVVSPIIADTENGVYLSEPGMTVGPQMKYFDKKTSGIIPLCNKPECLHDGNEFCAATNSKYTVITKKYYNDRILMNAVEQTDTRFMFKILCASNDGTSLEEFTTYYTSDNLGLNPAYEKNEVSMIVHRNNILALVSAVGENKGTDAAEYRGAAFINMDTKEIRFLNAESPLSIDNPKVINMMAIDDYIYFTTVSSDKRKRKALNRYNITTGLTEVLDLPGFTGKYSLLDSDRIVYTRPMASYFSVYTISTGVAEDYHITTEHVYCYNNPGESSFIIEDKDVPYSPNDFFCDGRYLFAFNGSFNFSLRVHSSAPIEDELPIINLFVYDLEMKNEVAYINLYDYLDHGTDFENIYFYLLDGRFYIQTSYLPSSGKTSKIEVCNYDSLLKGNPEWRLLMNY